jgi:hypothetical protein
MLTQVALGLMSISWMFVAAVLIISQKVFRPNAIIDLPMALTIVALGMLIVVAPSSVPGLMPPM